jgi:PAS domain S-box-containing protein
MGSWGVEKEGSESTVSKTEPPQIEPSEESLQKDTESYRLFMHHIKGFIGFWLDENFVPIFIDGAVKEVTGYDKEDFHSMNLKWTELIIPEDLLLFLEHINWIKSNPIVYAEIEYRLQRKDGEIRWIRQTTHTLPENYKYRGAIQGFVRDINELKMAEENRMKLEEAHKKEIHHRVKNNLQVISSILDLEAEMLAGNNVCSTSKVLEAFKESRNRIAAMAIIHEELYKSTDTNYLDFSAYLKKLTAYIIDSYNMETGNISLKLNLEQIYLGMDTAIPLGNIVTELISNALKHAFPKGSDGEISIFFCKKENYTQYLKRSGDSKTDSECQNIEDLQIVLVIKDNGIGFPNDIDFQNTDTLGLQIVNILVEQIDGCIELERNNGTKFSIWFRND